MEYLLYIQIVLPGVNFAMLVMRIKNSNIVIFPEKSNIFS